MERTAIPVEQRAGSRLPSLIESCMWFSRTLPSDVFHAYGSR